MKKSILFNIFIANVFMLIISCKVAPKPINYGKDHCALCDMTVVDKSHVAEYVTKKGKVYPFDSVECLVMKINKEQNEDKLAFILVADFEHPGNLVAAKTATYLISENIKSPMGANLSAFKSNKTAKKYQQEKGGEIYSWKTLKEKFSK